MYMVEVAAIIAWVLVQLYLGLWLIKGAPPKSITAKYAKVVIFQSMIPFMARWRAKIQSDDVSLFEEFRRRFLVFYAALLLAGAAFHIYIYVRYIFLLRL